MKYSGERIKRAGDELRAFSKLTPSEFDETFNVISFWRKTHEKPAEEALKLIQRVTRKYDKDALYSKRMKRTTSIFMKLMRYEKMSLAKMNDIGGCRAVVKNKRVLYNVLRELKKQPELKINSEGKNKINDYLKSPKDDGYRSVHIIGRFPDKEGKLRFVEIQLRTPIQHSWATAVEIIDLFTKQSLKSNQGNPEWAELFKEIGDQFSIMDRANGFIDFIPDRQFELYFKEYKTQFGLESIVDINSNVFKKLRHCYDLIEKLSVIKIFHGYANSLNILDSSLEDSEYQGYVLISTDLSERKTSARMFDNAEEAEEAYIEQEKVSDKDDMVVAMVHTPNISELRLAYPNYFADSTKFLKCVFRVKELFEEVRKRIYVSQNQSMGLRNNNYQ